jgi:dihydroorotase
VIIDGGRIVEVISKEETQRRAALEAGCGASRGLVFDGNEQLVLTSGFVDMHAHFREPAESSKLDDSNSLGFVKKETLESASLAAARGGYTSVVCMANTNPAIDNAAAASALKHRADALGLIRLYPAVSLSERMRGESLSPYLSEKSEGTSVYNPPLLSEDGKDIADDGLFAAAMREAAKRGALVSCHCDFGGEDAAVERAVRIGAGTGVRLHIAHISTKRTADIMSRQKKASAPLAPRTVQTLTAEATPHHIALTERDADKAGVETFGKVAPPLRGETDRLALIEALRDGVIDVIATDHAPHAPADKQGGAPGFSGLETAFAVCNTILVKKNDFSPQKLFSLLSATPARILGLSGRGFIAKGNYADIVILDTEKEIIVDSGKFASRGKNTLFNGWKLSGSVLLTLCDGKIVHHAAD